MTMRVIGCMLLLASLVLQACSKPVTVEGRVYEIRTYHAAPGKFDALQARFRDHTAKLFAKHGMENVAYWTLTEDRQENGRSLTYIISFPDTASRDAKWQAFGEDPDWQKAQKESEKEGRLVAKIDSLLVAGFKGGPVFNSASTSSSRIYELRTYKAANEKLPELRERLLGPLSKMLAKYGIELVAAWSPTSEEQGAKDTLICLMAHKSAEAANTSWKQLCEDPEWVAAVKTSEEKAKGPLTSGDVKSILLQPTDFSPLK